MCMTKFPEMNPFFQETVLIVVERNHLMLLKVNKTSSHHCEMLLHSREMVHRVNPNGSINNDS